MSDMPIKNNSSDKIVPIKKERIDWLDGVKGIACVLLFVAHWSMAFYPQLFLGPEQQTHAGNLEVSIFNSPLKLLFFEGKTYVSLFCLISGIFASLQIMNMSDAKGKMPGIIIKKYLRLMLPVVPVAIIVCIFSQLGLFSNLEAANYTYSAWMTQFYREPISIFKALSSAVITTWFYGDATLSTALWMMSQMFYGSFLSIILGCVYWKYKKGSILVYIFAFLCFMPRHDYVCIFALSAIFAWLYKEGYVDLVKTGKISESSAVIIGTISVALGLFLGNFPEFTDPAGIYVYMSFGFNEVYYYLAAFFIVYGVFNLKAVQKFLSIKPLKSLGVMCYDLVIIHVPMIFSFTTGIFILFMKSGMAYNAAALSCFAITLPLLILLSYLYNRYWGRCCGFITDKALDFFENRDAEAKTK